jgi:hypothetical protein
LSSTRESKLLDKEWEEIYEEFKGNKEKIKRKKEEWMKGKANTWEEQYARAKLKLKMAMDDYYAVQEWCRGK